MIVLIISAVIWYALGIWSVIEYLRMDIDVDTDDLPLVALAAVLGPIWFIPVWWRGKFRGKVLFKKRETK